MRRKCGSLLAVTTLIVGVAFSQAQAASITNGGFEGGVTGTVPNGWSANAAYLSEPSFNLVVTNPSLVHSGLSALQIGNFNRENIPVLSQTITDTPGTVYTISFWAMALDSDSASRLDVFMNTSYLLVPDATPIGGTGVSITGTLPYTLESFIFTGTGSDVLSIAAYNNPAEYFVDDVSISGGTSVVPLPAALPLFATGLAGLGLLGWRRKRKAQAA
jgi:hypothetical protein